MVPPARKNSKILITGFGPFPGMPENPSTTLAYELAKRAESTFPNHTFVAHSFATEWASAERDLTRLYEIHDPILVLHFGMGNQKSAIHIERMARNQASGEADANGCRGCNGPILKSAPTRLKSNMPHYSVLQDLRANAINAHISNNAGSYLCNFIYFKSLTNARAQATPPIAAFIHLPTSICALNERRSPHIPVNRSPLLSWTDLIDAGMILISNGLNVGRLNQRHTTRNS